MINSRSLLTLLLNPYRARAPPVKPHSFLDHQFANNFDLLDLPVVTLLPPRGAKRCQIGRRGYLSLWSFGRPLGREPPGRRCVGGAKLPAVHHNLCFTIEKVGGRAALLHAKPLLHGFPFSPFLFFLFWLARDGRPVLNNGVFVRRGRGDLINPYFTRERR